MPNRKKTQELAPISMDPVFEEPEFYDVELEKAREAFATDIDRSLVRYGFTLLHSLSPEMQARVLKHLGITRTDSAKDQYNLGCILAMDGDLQGAVAAFAAAAKLDTELPEAAFNLALALEKTGETAAAKEQWLRYVELTTNEAEKEAVAAHAGSLA